MKHFLVYIFLGFLTFGCSQERLVDVLKKYNSESVPYISVENLASSSQNVTLLDAREAEEFAVSHLENAHHVGYEYFDLKATIQHLSNKSDTIVVYCSVGVRSEDIAEQLKNAGFRNVYNLFGGIFEWKNKSFPVYDVNGEETNKVHVYSKKWGKWLKNGTKIYD